MLLCGRYQEKNTKQKNVFDEISFNRDYPCISCICQCVCNCTVSDYVSIASPSLTDYSESPLVLPPVPDTIHLHLLLTTFSCTLAPFLVSSSSTTSKEMILSAGMFPSQGGPVSFSFVVSDYLL